MTIAIVQTSEIGKHRISLSYYLHVETLKVSYNTGVNNTMTSAEDKIKVLLRMQGVHNKISNYVGI